MPLTTAQLRARVEALCPGVASLGPSPLERWEVASVPVWVKRDDLLGEGGSKVRKLLCELPAARARDQRVLTFGYLDSNHALATARIGARLGIPVELSILGTPEADRTRAELLQAAAPTRFHRSVAGLGIWTAWRLLTARLRGERLLRFPPGGTTPRSTAAVALAVAEVVDQLQQRGEPLPEHLVVAVGTGGTLAGLLAGAAALGVSVRIHGVASSTRLVGTRRVRRLANQALELLGVGARVAAGQVEVAFEQLGGGHGRPTEQSARVERALQAQGHRLDPVFTAKAVAYLEAHASPSTGEGWLLWHTGTAVE